VIGGHSSGGQLVGLAMLEPRFLHAYRHTKDEVCGVILANSGYDISAQYAFGQGEGKGDTPLMRAMIGVMGGQENFSTVFPINYVQPDLSPILLIHGDEDQTVPVSIAVDFHAALQ